MMEAKRKHKWEYIILIGLVGILFMFWVELVLQPSYPVKSALKVVAFTGAIGGYGLFAEENLFRKLIFCRDANRLKPAVIGAGVVIFLILLGFLLWGDMVDVQQIKGSLREKEHIDEGNFILAFAYVALVNSFIEELFFRGFLYLELSSHLKNRVPMILSSLAFSLYHIGIVANWGEWRMIFLAIGVLFGVGLLFNFFCKKADSILPSWIIHGTANITINVIGAMIIF